jgi:hypothetical protein
MRQCEFPPVKIDFTEKAIFWKPWLRNDDHGIRIWATPGMTPYEAYRYNIVFFNWLEPEQRFWGYTSIYHDCEWFETFGLWFFNISWVVPSSYTRCERR